MEIKLGQDFSQEELKLKFQAIYGGVAWPGKLPGYAVVAAMGRVKHLDNYDIYLLGESESEDTRELIKQCGVLDYKYQPSRWIGDSLNDAADRFVQEMNSERDPEDSDYHRRRRQFHICATPILDMQPLYPYIFPEIKRLLEEKCRRLSLKGSKIPNYLAIKPNEIAALELGDYPAIEALAFAVLELRQYGAVSDLDLPDESDVAGSYSTITAV